ncbi:MAG: prepilin-type N-terminal cleavage/methylation domain-containing protein [Thermoguttaceae bacterium]|nr:prepilin-type N-terminal cleavage/methylation domain-containing protein [Thermoguttaceae bacterium]
MGKAESYTIEPAILSFRNADNRPFSGKGKGYTLIEVMIAVTLTLVLMYALAAIFGRVTSIMTQTQDILSMTNNLRAAKDRLREDLENLTVPHLKAPTSKYGFFSYSEGLGNAFQYLDYGGYWKPDNSRKFTTYGNFDRRTPTVDNTVGDTDDILSFTVRAPAGKWFRGRCFKELPEDTSSSDYASKIDDNIETIESEYAEVIWFLRGTTLYRRVLLIVPDELLEKRLQSLNRYLQVNSEFTGGMDSMPSFGYGFYRFFDISVHYDSDKTLSWDVFDKSTGQKIPYPENGPLSGRVVANTVSDLANRKNRFGYWNSPVIRWDDVSLGNVVFDLGLHGKYGSWYWLRMPTLQESALWTASPDSDMWPFEFFRAGFPFGRSPIDSLYEQPVDDILRYWMGEYLRLGLGHNGPNPERSITFDNENLPADPFIDEWQFPNPWVQQHVFSGQLDLTGIVDPARLKTLNNDVLLTNVLSFDVKVWNDKSSSFVDLGEQSFYEEGELETDPSDFRSSGNYSPGSVKDLSHLCDPVTLRPEDENVHKFYRPIMPAIFDTWTEDYQKAFLTQTWPLTINGETNDIFAPSSRPGFTVGDIPLDGNVTAADLPDYPPPYEAEIKVIQVELRTFDPVSRTIKNATVEIKIP